MARMIPALGPKNNDSKTAEPTIYYALAKQLPDEFIVIHSLPWLASAAKEITGKQAITGEIDFLILHQEFGILAVEIKGGALRYDQGQFVFRNGERVDPISQVRKGVHALSHWIKDAGGPALRIGYAIAFPESSMNNRLIPPALIDMTDGKTENICIDKLSIPFIKSRIESIMEYWKRHGVTWGLGKQKIEQIIHLLCPIEDYSLTWKERIQEDSQKWLLLTEQQNRYLQQLSEYNRILITGRSGTGKTLLATTWARRLSNQGKKVLFIVYNILLAIAIKKDLANTNIEVMNFHQLCRNAASELNTPVDPENKSWFEEDAPHLLRQATSRHLLPSYNALVIDETQVFSSSWLEILEKWFTGKPILSCCDEAQVFDYEHHTTIEDIKKTMNIKKTFLLTENIRSPRPVFERLEKFIPADYAQQSPRPYDPESFQEIITHEDELTEETLVNLIKKLRKEGVPGKSIMVIYFKNKPNLHGLEFYVGPVVSVYRCRGIESPVVIVFADMTIEKEYLLCAYSRATTKCIALYARRSFTQPSNHRISSLYREIVKKTELNEIIEKKYPVEKSFDFVKIPLADFDFSFYRSIQWGGWILIRDKGDRFRESMEFLLWQNHIQASSGFPHYRSYISVFPGRIDKYNPSLFIGKTFEAHKYVNLEWCDKCEKWTRHNANEVEGHTCLHCFMAPIQSNMLLKESNKYAQEGIALSSNKLPISKDNTIYLVALAKWKVLPRLIQFRIKLYTHLSSVNRMNDICKLFCGIYVANCEIGTEITPDIIFNYSLLECPWLENHVKIEDWKIYITKSLGKLAGITPPYNKWLEKITPKKYKRIQMPKLDEHFIKMFLEEEKKL